ncbi:MAG TPA: glycosyltransferase family 39 protein [Candidatus Limnocylindrales bacterium]
MTTASLALPAERDLEAASRRLATIALALTFLVGAGVRLWAIDAVGLNSDEAVYSGQAAALAAQPGYSDLFAIFRAHPLGVQFLLSLLFRFGVSDVAARLLAVAFGLAAIGLTYRLGADLFSRRVGLIAAVLLAVMPYHVAVSRQILLDGPMTTFFLLTIWCLARYTRTSEARWLYATAFAGGLTFLAKETGVLVIPAAGAFALLTPRLRLGPVRLAVSALLYLVAISPYPAAIVIGGGSDTARQFLVWQLLRQPNHPWTFYADILPGVVGPLVVLAALVGLVLAVRRAGWEDRLLVAWLAVPVAFFEIWPVKGFQYLLPVAPAVAILAARALDAPWLIWLGRRRAAVGDWLAARPVMAPLASLALVALVLTTIAVPSAQAVSTTTTIGSLAGTGGLPGGREAGLWIRAHVPEGATFMTIGPTMANIVEYYGQRRALGLSVSPNPQRRNPAYDPIINPDRSIQLLRVQYIAEDVWSAARSPFFLATLRKYVAKYHGVLVYEQRALTRDASGAASEQVVIRIYEVRP